MSSFSSTQIVFLIVIFPLASQQQTSTCTQQNSCVKQEFNSTGTDCNSLKAHEFPHTVIPPGFALESLDASLQFQYAARTVQLGFTSGGSADVNTFRRNVENDMLPIPTDVTDEGIFAEYHFNLNKACDTHCSAAFCPAYNIAISPDPINNEIIQTYLAMGLDSGMNSDQLRRPPLNLIFLLDVSASMNYGFDGEDPEQQNPFSFDSKFKVAIDVMSDVVDMLSPQDAVGVVTFESVPDLIYPLQELGKVQPGDIKDEIRSLSADGRTNLQLAIDLAAETMNQYDRTKQKQYENRIIIITDAQPNEGDISLGGLTQRINLLSQQNIHTSIVGVGLDFNTQLANILTATRGANYFSVKSREDFRKVLVDGFQYMVYPLVYDLTLQLHEESQIGWKIIKAYGSGNNFEAIQENGVVLQVPTLFPSPENEAGIRGGVILSSIKQLVPDVPLKLKVSYTNRTDSQTYEIEDTVQLPDFDLGEKQDAESDQCKDFDLEKCALVGSLPNLCNFPEIMQDCVKSCNGDACKNKQVQEWYDTPGMRKAVLLARYADLLRSWLLDEWEIYVQLGPQWCEGIGEDHQRNIDGTCTIMEWLTPQRSLVPTPDQVLRDFSDRWERETIPLILSDSPLSVFGLFFQYMQSQIEIIGDDRLQYELDFLANIIEKFGK